MLHLVPRSLDDFIDAFERDCLSGSNRGLKDYLPERSDALYLPVLRELVRIDLEQGWESHRPRALEDYRADFPELFADAQSLQEVAFEEYRLRRRAGQTPTPEEYSRRFGVRTDGWPAAEAAAPDPIEASIRLETAARSYREFRFEASQDASVRIDDWAPPAEVGSEVARLFKGLHEADGRLAEQVADGLSSMPRPGGEFAGFQLIAELGRGAFGRVYLARQAALAGRPVALKLAPDVGGESQTLAQLQHTHIVPIYSAHRSGPLQAVCMPYCGSVTVADITRRLRAMPRPPRDGLSLLAALPEKGRPAGVAIPEGPSPAVREVLAALDYPSAVLWLGGRIAEGLAHAHERGILHRDIKPANLLLTDEGLPMLLDFNVSEDIKRGAAAAAMLGGTLPYMAPEHLGAFRHGQGGVDGRGDVYSLGIVLFELLTGRFPFAAARLANSSADAMQALLGRMLDERSAAPPCPRKFNPSVSHATAAIVRHCLEPDPARRYQSAKALHEDIERHLRHEPLRHAPEPSLLERGHKWLRRNPRFGLKLSVAGVALLAMLAAMLGWRSRNLEQVRAANEKLAMFAPLFRRAQSPLLAGVVSDEERLDGEKAARTALGMYGALDDPDWQSRPLMAALADCDRRTLRAEQGELLLLLAESVSRRDSSPDSQREAAAMNERAEICFDPRSAPPMIWKQRARLLADLDPERAKQAEKKALSMPNRSVRDRYLEGADLAANRHFRAARELLEKAVADEPNSYAAQFLLATAYEGHGNEAAACRCYSACIALVPGFYAPYQGRGLSYARQRKLPEAKADLDRAVSLAPYLAAPYFNRATVFERYKGEDGKPRAAEGIADLNTAIDRGMPDTRVYFVRSRLRRHAGDLKGAKEDFDKGLKLTPTDEKSWVARGFARIKSDPRGALADFDEALKVNPTSQNALMDKANVLAEILGDRGKVSPAEYLAKQSEARVVLERAVSVYPEYAPALAGLAVVLARLGQRDAALSHIDLALEFNKEGETLYQAGCVFALTSALDPDDAPTALFYLRGALDAGFGLGFLDSDDDLRAVRDHPVFAKLSRLAAMLREQPMPPRRRAAPK